MATPLAAVTVVVPPSVPPLAFAASATVTLSAKPVATLPSVSSTVTWTGSSTLSTVATWGGTVKASRAAAAGATANVALVAPRTPGDVATSV